MECQWWLLQSEVRRIWAGSKVENCNPKIVTELYQNNHIGRSVPSQNNKLKYLRYKKTDFVRTNLIILLAEDLWHSFITWSLLGSADRIFLSSRSGHLRISQINTTWFTELLIILILSEFSNSIFFFMLKQYCSVRNHPLPYHTEISVI